MAETLTLEEIQKKAVAAIQKGIRVIEIEGYDITPESILPVDGGSIQTQAKDLTVRPPAKTLHGSR